MDTFNRTFSQFQSLYQSMSPTGRAFLVALPLLVAAAFGVLLWDGESSSHVPLSWNQAFTLEEISNAQQTLQEAGLDDFKVEGSRILVPRGEEAKYNAVLMVDGSLPAAPTSELEKQIISTNIFRSRDQLQAIRDIELQKAVNRVLRAVPDIEQAAVRWARSRAGRWPRQGSQVTATVSVKPRGNRELSSQLVRSLQLAVANMVPDLDAQHVTVFDTSTGISHTPDEEDDPFDSRLVGRIREFTRMYEKRIGSALSYIPEVLITVNVDIENLKRSVSREQQLDPKKMVPGYSQEETVSENYQQQASRSEPGARPNQPRSLSQSGGPDQSRAVERAVTTAANIPSWKITETELIAAMPKSVQVSVAIPRTYFSAAAEQQRTATGDETAEGGAGAPAAPVKSEQEIIDDVRRTVAKAIGTGSTPEDIQVNSYVAVTQDLPSLEPSMVDQAGMILAEWGSAIGLGLFALAALWMLQRTTPPLTSEQDEQAALQRAAPVEEEEEEEIDENFVIDKKKTPGDHEKLQQMVRNNPEIASAVVGQWLKAFR